MNMRSKSTVVAIVVGLLVSSAAFMAGIAVGANSAAVSVVRETPNAMCFKDTSPDQFTEKHIETKLKACQVVGMTKQAALDFLEKDGITVRIAYEDGEYFALTEDYRDDRVNLEILVGLIVGASAW